MVLVVLYAWVRPLRGTVMPRTMLITGATSGFGRAAVYEMVNRGWNVVATGRRIDRLEALRQDLASDLLHTVEMDVTDEASVDAAIISLPESITPITSLVNNAGLALGVLGALEADMDDWRTMVDTNIMGMLTVTAALLPQLVETGPGASIINLGSVSATVAYTGANVYGATKAFVRQWSRNLRTDLVGTGVRVTDVSPGMGETEFTVVRTHGDVERSDNFYQGAKALQPQDIADCIAWVAEQPAHVNVNLVEVMPISQVWQAAAVDRDV